MSLHTFLPPQFLAPGIVGAAIAGRRGRSRVLWFTLSAILPLLVLVPLFLPPAREVPGRWKVCPRCRELIRWEAVVCRHCQNELYLKEGPHNERERG